MKNKLQLQELIIKMKNPETGVVVRDRKSYLKVFRQCFVGKEAVSWLLVNANQIANSSILPHHIKTREDAVKLADKLFAMKVFYYVTLSKNHSKFEDDNSLYTFEEKYVQSSDETPPSSPTESLTKRGR